jgi:hypothetical protein
MSRLEDPFDVLSVEQESSDFATLTSRDVGSSPSSLAVGYAATARLQGFSLDNQPLLAGLEVSGGELFAARTTVPLLRSQIGSTVVVLFERGDVHRPIIVGILEAPLSALPASVPVMSSSVESDGHRVVLSADREIVLRCGAASITLTRAGKVLIKGAYIVSRSSGYNKIKGAAVDIN